MRASKLIALLLSVVRITVDKLTERITVDTLSGSLSKKKIDYSLFKEKIELFKRQIMSNFNAIRYIIKDVHERLDEVITRGQVDELALFMSENEHYVSMDEYWKKIVASQKIKLFRWSFQKYKSSINILVWFTSLDFERSLHYLMVYARNTYSYRVFEEAVARGMIKQATYLNRYTERCSTRAFELAAANGHFSVVKWFFYNRPEISVRAFEMAYKSGRGNIACWLFERLPVCL
jgi:hypothetical protein